MPSGDCNSCPTNVCIADSSNSSNRKNRAAVGEIAGPVVVTLGIFIIAAVFVYYWWHKRKLKAIASAQARAEAKFRDAKTKTFKLRDKGSAGEAGRLAEVDAETEWTEMRADGLQTFPPQSSSPGGRTHTDDQHHSVLRYSSGAATHLSRITEGAEDAEDTDHEFILIHDDGDPRCQTHRPSSTVSGISGATSSGFLSSRALSRRLCGMQNPFEPENDHFRTDPLDSPLPTTSEVSCQSSAQARLPDQPSPAHRPKGAPVLALDVQGLQPYPGRPIRDESLNLRLHDISAYDRNQERRHSPPYTNSKTSQRRQSDQKPSALDPFLSAASPTAESLRFPKPFSYQQGDGATLSPRYLEAPEAVDLEDARSNRSISSSVHTSHSGISDLSYVYSSPQIVTVTASTGAIASAEGIPPAVHKAQLVRNLSEIRRSASQKRQRECSTQAVASPQDPFGDENVPCEHSAATPDAQGPIASASDAEKVSAGSPTSRDESTTGLRHLSLARETTGRDISVASTLPLPPTAARSSTASSEDGLSCRIPIFDLTQQGVSGQPLPEGVSGHVYSQLPSGASGERARTCAGTLSGGDDSAPNRLKRRQLSPRDVRQDDGEDGCPELDEEEHPDRPPSNWLGSPRATQNLTCIGPLPISGTGTTACQGQPNRFTASSLGGLSVLDGFDWSMPTDNKPDAGETAVPPLPPWIQKRRDS